MKTSILNIAWNGLYTYHPILNKFQEMSIGDVDKNVLVKVRDNYKKLVPKGLNSPYHCAIKCKKGSDHGSGRWDEAKFPNKRLL